VPDEASDQKRENDAPDAAQPSWSVRHRFCPHCKEWALERRRLPFYLRPLRRFGLNVRAYTCMSCSRNSTTFLRTKEHKVPPM
jgi:hypothetical protein